MERQLTSIARRGLDAANELVERFAAALHELDDPASGTDDDGAARAGSVADAMGRAMAETVRATADAWGGLDTRPEDTPLDLTTGGGAVVVLDAADPGRWIGELWIHNPSADDITDLTLAAGPLWSADAPEIDADAVGLAPAIVPLVAAGASERVEITVTAPAVGPPGRHRGVVQVVGRHDAWALVDLKRS